MRSNLLQNLYSFTTLISEEILKVGSLSAFEVISQYVHTILT